MNRIVSIILLLIFVTTAHAVYWACSPVEGGKITGEDKAKLAIPNAGYKFLYWKSQANNGTPSYKYENPADLSGCAFLEAFRPEVTVYVTAFFEKSQEIYDTIYFNAYGGIIPTSGNMGKTPEGHTTGISADRQTGYVVVTQGQPYFGYMSNDCPSKNGSTFKGWYTAKNDGEQVYDSIGAYVVGNYWDNNGNWKGTSNVTLYAQWKQLQYKISTSSINGIVTGSGTFNYGDTATLMATPNEGYQFEKWSDGNSDNPRQVVVTQDSVFTAIFDKKCTITVSSNDSTMGHVNGGGLVVEGSTTSLYAFAYKGYHFVKWSDGYTNNPRTVTISSDTTFVAEFAPDPKLTVLSNNEELGSASIVKELLTYSKQLFILYTLPNSWTNPFVWDWTNTGTGYWAPLIKLEDTKYVYLAPTDHLDMLIANFPQGYTISELDWSRKTAQTIDLHINGRYCLRVESDQNYAQVSNMGCHEIAAITDIVKISANPTDKGIFENWSDGVTMNPRYVLVSSDSTIIANFIPNQYTITTVSTCGTITGGGIYSLGDTATLFVTPDEGCHFTQWSDGNTDNPRQVIVNKDSTFIAEFSVEAAGDVEYVDLGLSVLWATCNLGATKPTEAGNYYAWGELEPKKVYNWETYKFWAGSSEHVTKYGKYDYGYYADDKNQLELIDDVARYKYGKGWRLPTDEEFMELKNSCDWSSANSNGVEGCLITSKINGKSVFIPVAGHYEDSLITNSEKELYYFSSTIWSRHPRVSGFNISNISSFNQKYSVTNYCCRQLGYPIRPVCDKHVLMYNVQVLSEHGSASGSGQYSEGSIAQLSATTDDSCYVFARWSDGNSDNPRKLVVTQDTTLTAIFEQINYTITLDADEKKGIVVEEK